MERKEVNVYTKFDKIEENHKIFAIINCDVIKYIDLSNNIMIVNMKDYTLKRENSDYILNIDFKYENINIEIKKLKKTINKSIKTLLIKKTNKDYLVRYVLDDENVVNEYYVKF